MPLSLTLKFVFVDLTVTVNAKNPKYWSIEVNSTHWFGIVNDVPITFKSWIRGCSFEKCSKFYWKHFLIWVPVSELGELFKIAQIQKYATFFEKSKTSWTFLIFLSYKNHSNISKNLQTKTVITVSEGANYSDIATGKGSCSKCRMKGQI